MNPFIDRIQQLCTPLQPIPTDLQPDLPPIEGLETILFDIYGTLLISGSGDVGTARATNSSSALYQALVATAYHGDLARASQLGPSLLSSEIAHCHADAHRNNIEFPEVNIASIWKKIIATLHSLDLLDTSPDDPQILQLALEYECRVNPVCPMPGALETLKTLRERGVRLGIVSNAQFYTPLILDALFGGSVAALGFDPSLCVWSYQELRAKPDRQLFERVGRSTDLSRTLYVGNDMLNDIWTATQAGCRTALFAGDRRSLRLRDHDGRCKRLRPDAIITDLRQLYQWI